MPYCASLSLDSAFLRGNNRRNTAGGNASAPDGSAELAPRSAEMGERANGKAAVMGEYVDFRPK